MNSLREELLRAARVNSQCILCDIVRGAPWVPFRSLFRADEVKSEVLLETEHFIVIADIGPIVEGYVLVVTKEHHLSIACLSPSALKELAAIRQVVGQAQSVAFASPICFEHGSGSDRNGAGACIDHAHMHMVPVLADPSTRLFREFPFERVKDLAELCSEEKRSGYLYYEDLVGNSWGILTDRVPKQFFRQVLQATQDPASPWDWRAFVTPRAISSTRKRISLTREKLLPLLPTTI